MRLFKLTLVGDGAIIVPGIEHDKVEKLADPESPVTVASAGIPKPSAL